MKVGIFKKVTQFTKQGLVTIVIIISSVHAQFMDWPGNFPPPHDTCISALPLPENSWVTDNNRLATLGPSTERPADWPGTCIQTYENDLWYSLDLQPGEEYEISIVPEYCATPAGLQALLIKSRDCNPMHFQYLACENRKNLDTLRLIFITPIKPIPNVKYFLYVDGFDGNTCQYGLHVKHAPGAIGDPRNLRFLQYYTDDNLPEPSLEAPNILFENNQSTLSWIDPLPDSTANYRIEAVLDSNLNYFQVLQVLTPQSQVQGYQNQYVWTDSRLNLVHDQNYAYRLVKLLKNGEVEISRMGTVKAKVQNDFRIIEVVPSRNKGFFTARYLIRKKQDYEIAIVNQEGTVLKSKAIKNLEVGEHISELDLTPFPKGNYNFRIRSGNFQYVTPFIN
ncbi:MAG: hypothetical protein EBS07_08350 [Sphingobacteriia bacterium]|nr:hypothetical protein [Sphingobacteriia bacterium]